MDFWADRARIVEIDEHPGVAFNRQQHVGEAARHVRADRLALIGADDGAQRTFVRRDAEVIGPEPRQPLGKADLRGQRGIEPGLGLLEKDLLGNRTSRIGLGGASGPVRHLVVCARVGCSRGIGARLRSPLRGRLGGVLLGAGDEARRLALLAKIECRASGFGTGEEIGIAQAPGARPRKIGDESAAGIGGDCGQRSLARTEAETMQGKSGLQFCVRTGICRHGVTSDATA